MQSRSKLLHACEAWGSTTRRALKMHRLAIGVCNKKRRVAMKHLQSAMSARMRDAAGLLPYRSYGWRNPFHHAGFFKRQEEDDNEWQAGEWRGTCCPCAVARGRPAC